MSIEVVNYKSLGTYKEIKCLFCDVLTNELILTRNIENYCLSKDSLYRVPTKGIIALLEFVGLIHRDCDSVRLTIKGMKMKRNLLHDKEQSSELIFLLLKKVIRAYSDFITLENIIYDSYQDCYYIKNNKIPLKYSNLKNLLIHLGFFAVNTQTPNNLQINRTYLPKLKELLQRVKFRMSLKKMKRLQQIKEQMGEEAELFVIKYERERLKSHLLTDRIQRISDLDVNAGYDIVSFNSLESDKVDRFIEVKSFKSEVAFYWSKGEINTARRKKNSYFIYMVDRNKMNQPGYQPLIIQNPYQNVFTNDDWVKEPQEWYCRLAITTETLQNYTW